MELPFLHGPLSATFRRHRVVLAPGRSRPFDSAEWCDALVVVEHGRLHLECHDGGLRSFGAGSVVTLDGLALRSLHNRGHEPTVLVAVRRRRLPERAWETTPAGPRIIDLPARPYLGIRRTVTRIATVADRIPEIVAHLVDRGVAPAGAPFLRHHVIAADGRTDVEAGVPVDDPSLADGDLRSATLPAGRFAVARHVGRPDGLVDATAVLLDWAAARDLRWDRTVTGGDERWGCRAVHLLTRAPAQPDPHLQETELVFRLR